ncbi:MAG: branched-chain amino acid ABC transporter permease [Candidatus Paceibacterota bacterium]
MDILPQIILNSLIAGSLYALAAMSFNLIYGVSRSFNLAHGVFATVAAYAVLFLAFHTAIPLPLTITLGILMAVLLGYLLERSIFRPLRLRKASNLVLLIASLGASIVVEALIAIFFSSQFQTLSSLLPPFGTLHILGGTLTDLQAFIIICSVVVLGVFWLVLSYTRFGKAVRAVSDDEEVAKIVGINTNAIIGIVFMIGAGVMGLAGILAGFDTGLEPHMGFILLLGAAIAAVVGGVGNVYGAFLGAFILGFAENFGVFFVSGEWKYAIAFGVLILFLLFRPQGILGKK